MVIYRIGSQDLKVYEVSQNSIKESKKEFPGSLLVINLFKAHNNLKELIDEKDSHFLKGELNDNQVRGARISVLPNGQKLDKAYSLFAPKLTIHDEKSSSHWDVIFQNPNGKMAYLYTLEKSNLSTAKKYEQVEEFEKLLPRLKRNLAKNLSKDPIVLPLEILLKTKMRVGNELYYKQNSHKGLTTLKKKDVKVSGNKVVFDYVGKSGVPQKITEIFPEVIVKELSKLLRKKKSDDFVFTKNNKPIKDTEFEKAFKKYCGKKFYPHIIRSHYATEETIKFLEDNPSPTKDEVKEFYTKIAEKLGHKKFSKKKNEWQDSYQITMHHYINPKLVEKINSIIS